LKRNARSIQNEGGNAETFPLERVRFQVLSVGTGLRLRSRTDGPGIQGIFARHHPQRNGGVGDIARDRPGVVEQPVQRRNAGDAHQAARGENADHRTGGGRHADRVAGIGSVAKHRIVRSDGRDRAARRAAGAEAHVVSVSGAPESRAAIGIAGREIRHIGLPDDNRSGRAQFGDNRCIFRRHQFMAGNGVAFPSIRGDQPFDAGIGFRHNRDAPQRAARKSRAARLCVRVFALRAGHRAGQIQILHRAINPVVLLNRAPRASAPLRSTVYLWLA
jgi:hypothetical protein